MLVAFVRTLFGYAVAGLGGYLVVTDAHPFAVVPFFAGFALICVGAMIAHPAQAIPAFSYCVSGVRKLWPGGKKDEPHVHRRKSDAHGHKHQRHTPPARMSVSEFTISEPRLPVEDPREPTRRRSDG